MLRGTFITMSVWGPVDSLSRRVAEMWMPWLGKSFDPSIQTGVNVLTKSARGPMKALWPSYVPERELTDRIEAFPFRTRIAPGEVDPDVQVLKIDYDSDPNPNFVIRRILDELVQGRIGVAVAVRESVEEASREMRSSIRHQCATKINRLQEDGIKVP